MDTAKQCTTCGTIKPLNQFNRDKSRKGGLRHRCKACGAQGSNKYRKSFKGLTTDIYAAENRHSRARGHKPPQYTKAQLIDWLQSQPHFTELYNNWVDSDYYTDLKPSVDRLDNTQTYTLDNIQLVTWAYNRAKQ